jgi:hypothetical protein
MELLMKDSKFQKAAEKIDPENRKMLADLLKNFRISEKIIARYFLDAINNYDGQKVYEIAEAVWFLKGRFASFFEGGGNQKDPERALLILTKSRLDRDGKKWKRRQVAEYLYGKDVKSDDVDWTTVIAKCRAMNFPLDEKRRTRKK